MTDKEFYDATLEERCDYVLKNMKSIRFYKEDGQWYADVKGHSKEDNEMVAGADLVLDAMSAGRNSVYLNVSDKIYPKAKFLFHRVDHNQYGATYVVLENHPDAPALSGGFLDLPQKKFWLCNVTHTFFGEHPEYISVI